MIDVDYVVWDFDGVLNANVVDGRFIWQDRFEQDLGHSLETFTSAIFNEDFASIICGEKDLLDHVSEWAAAVGYDGEPETILAYWFRSDSHPDPIMLTLMQKVSAAGRGNVIATNNEPRRASYIEREMGFGSRVARVFASGHLRCAKPAPDFFEHVTDQLGVQPDRLILVDDSLANVEAAAKMGWQSHHFRAFDYPALEARLSLG